MDTQPNKDKTMLNSSLQLVAAMWLCFVLVASACASDSSTSERVFPLDAAEATAEPTVDPRPPSTAAGTSADETPASETSPTEAPATVALAETTIEKFGIASTVPAEWVEVDDGVFEGDGGQLAFGAWPQWAIPDLSSIGLVELDAVTAGGREWIISALETPQVVVFLATTAVDDTGYFVQLVATPARAAEYTDSIGQPALDAFEILDPDATESDLRLNTTTIEGRQVAYASGGSGAATVVFEAGHGSSMAAWADVAGGVAEFARVVAYDRPGYGRSDPATSSRDAATMVAELRELLAGTGHEPPYVLVGHSLGGTVMDLYARTHPDEVAGLVLVDSRHHAFTNRCVADFGDVDDCVVPDEAIETFPPHMRDEWRDFADTEAQVAAAPTHGADLAVTVITAGVKDAEGSVEAWELWQQTQADYATMVPNATHIVAHGIDHQIPTRAPELIVDALAEMLGHSDAGASDASVPVELQAVADELVAEAGLPAVGVTVFDSKDVIDTVIAGVRRTGDSTPADISDRFSIGSNAKAMTATLVATYVDEGEISWDTTVGEIFGASLPTIHADFEDISFRQLLSHTAGIDDEADDSWVGPLLDATRPVGEQRHDIAEIALARPQDHAAGSYLYSNVGYTIVGAMLEELTGSPWETQIRTRVFDALDMGSCGFLAPGTPGELDQPWGHWDQQRGAPMDPGEVEADYPAAIAPAGLVHCNMADWMRFLQSQLSGFRGSDAEIVSRAAFSAIETAPSGSNYALGWVRNLDPDGTVTMYHNGSNDRFTAEVWLIPEEDWGLLMVTNVGELMANPALARAGETIVAARPTR